MLPLTDIQRAVHEMDRAGSSPSAIAEHLHLSVSRVANVKARLRALGYPVTTWRHYGPSQKTRDKLSSYAPVNRCICGLILPCHSCLGEAVSANSQPAHQNQNVNIPERHV